jgi:hypothetical protein
VTFYRKARQEMPWGDASKAISEELWNEYVLPYRIQAEELDDFRPEFYTELAPLVKTTKNTSEASRKIHQWLYFGNKTGRIQFKIEAGDYRDLSPRRPPFFEWTMTHFRKQTDDWNKY